RDSPEPRRSPPSLRPRTPTAPATPGPTGPTSGSRRPRAAAVTPSRVAVAARTASGWGPPRGQEPGAWYRRICYHENGTSTGTIHWVNDRVDPAALAQQAADRVP